MTTLVDSNVILDLVGPRGPWFEWSRASLAERASVGPTVINDVVFAECATAFPSAEATAEAFRLLGLTRAALSDRALFLAAKAHLAYRRSGGKRLNVLPDFFVGAQAETERWTVLTRDRRHYVTYFPEVKIVTPEALAPNA